MKQFRFFPFISDIYLKYDYIFDLKLINLKFHCQLEKKFYELIKSSILEIFDFSFRRFLWAFYMLYLIIMTTDCYLAAYFLINIKASHFCSKNQINQ